jgi:hypothetical protein
MTVIAALRIEGIPALIGDFLVTDGRTDIPHFPLPTRTNMVNPFNPVLPHRINGMQRKCIIVNDRLAVGFTGHVEAAKYIFTALERRFGRQNRGPSLAELEATLRPIKLQLHSRKLVGMVMGWTIRNRPCCFYWKTALGERLTLVGMAIEGSGKQSFTKSLTSSFFLGYSPAIQSAYEKACLLGITKIGNVLVEEIISDANLALGYGYGAELALFNGIRFEFIPKIGFMFWNVRLEVNGSVSLAQANIMAVYENKGRYALLNIMQSHTPELGSLVVDNSFVAGLTPLHDDMPGLTYRPEEAPDMLCPYYYMCFSILDVQTGGQRRVNGACKMTDGFTLLRVEKRDDGKFYFTLNWREVEGLARDTFAFTPQPSG